MAAVFTFVYHIVDLFSPSALTPLLKLDKFPHVCPWPTVAPQRKHSNPFFICAQQEGMTETTRLAQQNLEVHFTGPSLLILRAFGK